MLSVVALIAVAGSQGSTETVSITVKAAPVAQVVAKIAEVTKTKLEVSQVMLPEVILVDVKDVSLETLLNKIATVTTGEWTQDGDVRRLVPATGIRNREASDEANQKLIKLRTTLAERIKQEADMRKEMEMPNYVSDDSVVTQLLQKVDLSVIANLEENGRVVFSTQPTSMQLPLGANSSAVINAFIAQHNTMRDAADVVDEPTTPDPDIPDFLKDMVPSNDKKIGAVQKALLIISKQETFMMESVQAELRLYDAKGAVQYRGNSYLSMGGAISSMSKLAGNDENKPEQPSPDAQKEIELSPESKELASFGGGIMGGMGSGAGQISKNLLATLAHPEKFDPLSFTVTDMVRALAKESKRPLVACIPDSAGGQSGFQFSATVTLKDAKDQVGEDGTMRVVADNDFLLIKPRFPSETRKDRLDRNALRTLIAAAEDHRVVTLDDMANYAMRAPNPMSGGIAQSYIMLVPGAFDLMAAGSDNWDALRFFGKLGPQHRQTLANGGRIAFSMLPINSGNDVSKMIFGAKSKLRLEDGKTEEFEMPGMFDMMGAFGGSGGKDYRTEPTEALPSGLRGQGFVSASVSSEPFLMTDISSISNQAPSGIDFVLGMNELAMLEMFRQDPKMSAASGELPQIKEAMVGQRTVWNFKFQVSSDVSVRATLNDNRLPSGAKKVAYGSMGSTFESQLAKRVAAIKNSPFGKMMSSMGDFMGGQQAPPPH